MLVSKHENPSLLINKIGPCILVDIILMFGLCLAYLMLYLLCELCYSTIFNLFFMFYCISLLLSEVCITALVVVFVLTHLIML